MSLAMSHDNKRSSNQGLDQPTKKKRRWGSKSRWGDTDEVEKEVVLGGLPMVIPTGLTKEQEEQYLLQLHIEEITRRLQTGELGIAPVGERSPSPEPVYDHVGKRTNTREVRTRRKLEDERHKLVQKVLLANPQYRPPADYKVPNIRYSERVFIPQDEHPEIGFIGMIIGPRGNSLRKIEKETGACIVIRGKGSVKDGRVATKDGKPLPGADEPLHAYITAFTEDDVKRGVNRIKKLINDAINVPDEDNEWMREQLHELAVINGTLRDNDTLQKLKDLRNAETIITNKILCHICGGVGHISKDCKQRRPGESLNEMLHSNNPPSTAGNAKLDVEYMSLMAELGQGPPPPTGSAILATSSARPHIHQHGLQPLALPAPLFQSSSHPSTLPNVPMPPPPPGPLMPTMEAARPPQPLMQTSPRPTPSLLSTSMFRSALPPRPPPLMQSFTLAREQGSASFAEDQRASLSSSTTFTNQSQQQWHQTGMPMNQFQRQQSRLDRPQLRTPQSWQQQQHFPSDFNHGFYGGQ